MSQLRKILFPFSIIYDGVTSLRNKLFDLGVLKSTTFDLPIIVVGNLSVGGTGKTPQIEYLINLLKDNYKIAILSRGYKRKSKGFLLANQTISVAQLGDEPYQFYSKYKNIYVAVDENRVHGIQQLQQMKDPPQIILLDDAFQHRKVNSDFNILLTPYNDLYIDDLILPAGNLRESHRGAKRARIIIITKCPHNISSSEKEKIKDKLKLQKGQQLFFTTIHYSDTVKGKDNSISLNKLTDYDLLLVTGIAKPKPLLQFLDSENISFEHIEFPDHHNFSQKDIKAIKTKLDQIKTKNKLILTTEKDYTRLKKHLDSVYLSIQVVFLENKNVFNNTIKTYITEKYN